MAKAALKRCATQNLQLKLSYLHGMRHRL